MNNQYRPYRRRRPPKRKSTSSGSINYAKIILAVLVIAGIIYFLTAGAAGKWVADNVITPIINLFEEPLPSSPPDQNAIATVPPTASQPAGDVSKENVKVPGITNYLLQIGVFKNQGNAQTGAEQVRQNGGAGHIYEDDSGFRVFAAAYETEQDAITVRDRLQQNDIVSTTFTLAIEGLDMDITSTAAQRASIVRGFEMYQTALKSICSLSQDFDAQSLTKDDCKKELETLTADLAASRTDLSTTGSNAVTDGMGAITHNLEERIQSFLSSQTQDDYGFSARLKELHIHALVEYADLIKELTAS
ncbi:MAG: SPOR domain-containing protein [Christensenellales bacterium]|jgi:hypothetical protein